MQEGPEYKVSLGYLVVLGYRKPCFRKTEKQPWISWTVDICELVSLFQELGWLRKQVGDRWEPLWFV